MPMPKAKWRLCPRVRSTTSGSSNISGSRLPAGKVEQHPLAGAHRAAADGRLDGATSRAIVTGA